MKKFHSHIENKNKLKNDHCKYFLNGTGQCGVYYQV